MSAVDFKVCVRCFTFNHAQYIKDAMDGFVMQQTNFPFVVTIVDDASTDGEQDVIRQYLFEHFNVQDVDVAYTRETDYAFITFAQHKTNINCYFAVLFLKENHYSKRRDKLQYLKEWRDVVEYEAICEGDDYWTHAEKLQMQVNVLDSNSLVGVVHTDFDLVSGKRHHFRHTSLEEDCLIQLLEHKYQIGTLTVMFRKTVFQSIPQLWKSVFPQISMGDYPMFIEMAYITKFVYLPVVSAKYRVLKESASHSSNVTKIEKFHLDAVNIARYYAKTYSMSIGNQCQFYYGTMMRYAFDRRDKVLAIKYKEEAVKKNAASVKMWICYYLTIVLMR